MVKIPCLKFVSLRTSYAIIIPKQYIVHEGIDVREKYDVVLERSSLGGVGSKG